MKNIKLKQSLLIGQHFFQAGESVLVHDDRAKKLVEEGAAEYSSKEEYETADRKQEDFETPDKPKPKRGRKKAGGK